MAICEGLRGGFRHIEGGQEPEDRESEKGGGTLRVRYGLIRARVLFCFLLELQVRTMSHFSLYTKRRRAALRISMLSEGIKGLCKSEMAPTAITLGRNAQEGPVRALLQSAKD